MFKIVLIYLGCDGAFYICIRLSVYFLRVINWSNFYVLMEYVSKIFKITPSGRKLFGFYNSVKYWAYMSWFIIDVIILIRINYLYSSVWVYIAALLTIEFKNKRKAI